MKYPESSNPYSEKAMDDDPWIRQANVFLTHLNGHALITLSLKSRIVFTELKTLATPWTEIETKQMTGVLEDNLEF
jgi:hypothetical protein